MLVRSNKILRTHVLGSLANSTIQCFSSANSDSLFLGLPKKVTTIGAPMHHGQPITGTDNGPKLIRELGLSKIIKNLGWECDDKGDIEMSPESMKRSPLEPFQGLAHNCDVVGIGNERVAKVVKAGAEEKSFVLTIGGDHSIGLGTLAGMLSVYPNLGVIWVDAHADINTPLTSESGNMHGMPVSFVMKLDGTLNLPGFDWLKQVPTLKPSQVAYIGLRDVDDGERKILRELETQGMYVTSMQDVDAVGIGAVVEDALTSLGKDRPIHLSYDIDALDPVLAPSTGTRVPGGLTFREGHFIAESLASTGQLVSMDMVEVNSMIGDSNDAKSTADLALDIISSALGSKIF